MTDYSSYTDDQLLNMLQPQQSGEDDGTGNTQMDGAARLPLMAASSLAKGAGKFLSTPGDVAQLYDAYIGAPFARAVSGQAPQFGVTEPNFTGPVSKVLPPSSQMLPSMQAAGVIDRPDLTAQNTGEQYLQSGMEGMGSNVPLALLGGGAVTAAKTLAQGAGAGLGDEVMKKIMPNSDAAHLFGSLLGGGLASSAADTTERAVNAVSGETSPLLQAYKEAGIKPRLVGDVSQNPTMQGIQAFASKAPFGGERVKDAADKTLGEFGDSAEKVAGMFGTASTLQEAGKSIQDEGKSWLSNWQTAKDGAWDKVNNVIGKTTPIPTSNTTNTINKITSSAQGNDALNELLKSPLTKNTINVLQAGNGALSWGQASALRTHVGQMLENPMLVGGPEQAQAKMLYGALTQDMKAGAFSTGNKAAVDAFNNANSLTSNGHFYIDNVLGDVMKANPEQAAKGLLSGAATGGTQLQLLRQQMPKAADQLAATSIRRMGAGESEGASGNAISPSRWLSNQDPTRRMSPEAYQALFSNPNAQTKMGALDTVASSMRSTERLVNHSNTGSNLEFSSMMTAPFAVAEGARLGHETAGLTGALTGAALAGLPFGSGAIAGRLATNPALARFMGTPTTSYQYGMAPALMNSLPNQISPQLQAPFSFAPSLQGAY